MEKTARRRLWWWLPAALWMGLIFFFSAQSGEQSGQLSGGLTYWLVSHLTPGWAGWSEEARAARLALCHLLVRKTAHGTEYAVLGALLFLAFRNTFCSKNSKSALWAALIGLLYAALDEGHQALVPGRGPAVTDVLIDFGGVLLGVAFLWLLARRKDRRKRKNPKPGEESL